MIRTGAEVGHHHEPLHPRLSGGVDHPDRGIPVDGVGARRVAAAGPGGEDDGVVPGDQIGQRIRVEPLDVGDDRTGASGRDVVGMLGVAEDRIDLVAAIGENSGEF